MGAKEGLRILMVITTLDVGGAERHLRLLSAGLKRQGHEIEIAYLKGFGSLAPEFRDMGVPVEKVAFESPLKLPAAVAALARRIRRGSFDIVHSHLLKADLVAALASVLSRPKTLLSSKHNDERALLNTLYSFVHGLITKRAARVIALSDHVGRFVKRHGRVEESKITRIYYGLDPDDFLGAVRDPDRARHELGIPEGTPVLIMVARFAAQKDHACLLEAARRMRDEGRDFRLLLVGDDPFGDHRLRMEKRCGELGLEDLVIFTGVRSDVPDLLSLSDIFVMPTRWEGLGLVFLEAMAFSLPVVSTRVSAVPEIVSHGETGTLVLPNDPRALKDALTELIENPEQARRYGRAGRERLASRFGLDRMIEETEALYRQCLGFES